MLIHAFTYEWCQRGLESIWSKGLDDQSFLKRGQPYLGRYPSRLDRSLSPTQRRILEQAPEVQAQFNAVQVEWGTLTTTFSNHVLDATQAYQQQVGCGYKPFEIRFKTCYKRLKDVFNL